MTGLSARAIGLRDRGLVRRGYAADLVLFDPATVRDAATWERPAQPSVGIYRVWVNGVLSLVDSQPTGQRCGRFLPRTPIRVSEANKQEIA